MRPGLVQNVSRYPVAVDHGPELAPGERRTVADVDHPRTAGPIRRGHLKILAVDPPAADPAPVFTMGADPGDHTAADVRDFLEHLDPAAPATAIEAARIAELERAGRNRSTVLAAADQLATPTASPEE